MPCQTHLTSQKFTSQRSVPVPNCQMDTRGIGKASRTENTEKSGETLCHEYLTASSPSKSASICFFLSAFLELRRSLSPFAHGRSDLLPKTYLSRHFLLIVVSGHVAVRKYWLNLSLPAVSVHDATPIFWKGPHKTKVKSIGVLPFVVVFPVSCWDQLTTCQTKALNLLVQKIWPLQRGWPQVAGGCCFFIKIICIYISKNLQNVWFNICYIPWLIHMNCCQTSPGLVMETSVLNFGSITHGRIYNLSYQQMKP